MSAEQLMGICFFLAYALVVIGVFIDVTVKLIKMKKKKNDHA